MAKVKSTAQTSETSPSSGIHGSEASVLPKAILEHHEKVLLNPMTEWWTRNQLPPVLLLTGQAGVGKRSVAYFLSQWIFCEAVGFGQNIRPPETRPILKPCGSCGPCLKFTSGQDVDFTEVLSDSNEDEKDHHSGTLKIDQFRKLKTTAGFGAHDGTYKIILIPNAERMTPQASNSVLKLLEEPPAGWIFLLTANDPSLLLPTLVSRCQIIRLKPIPEGKLQELLALSGVDSKRQKICSEFAQGSWRRAVELSSDEIWKQRSEILRFLKEPSTQLQPLIDWTSQEPSHFDILLDLLEQVTMELIRSSVSNDASSSSELSSHIQQVIRTKGSVLAARSFWFDRAENIALTRQESQTPMNKKILIQNLLLPWLSPWVEPDRGSRP